MAKMKNNGKKTALSKEQMKAITASQMLVMAALMLLKKADVPTDTLTPYIGEELIRATKYKDLRNRDASRKRVSRLVNRLMKVTPEEAARIKAERCKTLSPDEIKRVEMKLREKLREMGVI